MYIFFLFFIFHICRSDICNDEINNDVNYVFCANPEEYYCRPNNEQQRRWLRSLYDDAWRDRTTPKRQRREIRMLSAEERQKYYDAVNALKRDTSIPPSKYDVLALIHTNKTLCSAHRGANFLGWHRVYLLLYETALRQKDRSVVLPYWNSVVDNNDVTGAKNTPIFTDLFLGNGHGNVVSGPFGNWTTDVIGCPLTRNISGDVDATLMSPEIVNMIINDKSILNTTEVIYRGACSKYTIEHQHDMVHDWIGGDMALLNMSTDDPIFFMHHAFVDYIWEKFKEKQRRNGIDPEKTYYGVGVNNTDYDVLPFHQPHRTMDCFYWLKNIDGYWNNFTDLYGYEDLPKCPDCGGSKWLTCNNELGRCISLSSEKDEQPLSVTSENNKISSDEEPNTRTIVGAVIGSIAGVALVSLAVVLYLRYCRKDRGAARGDNYEFDNRAQQLDSGAHM